MTLYSNYLRFSVVLFLCSGYHLFGQGLKNSHHDFSGASWSNNEYCSPCHVPHNANMVVSNSPLWSHQQSTATYTLYSNSTLNLAPGQPSGYSKLCLSCHDGTVAVENHVGYSGGTFYTSPTFGSFTTDLSAQHPISFAYSSTLATADGQLHDPATTPSGLGGTIHQDLLQDGNMECTSCHDVHISRNTQGCTGCHTLHPVMLTVSLSLWKSNSGSALCLTCHMK